MISKLITSSKRPGFYSLVLASVLFAASLPTLVFGLYQQQDPPVLPAVSAGELSQESQSRSKATLPYSQPTHLRIPAIDINADLISVGKTEQGMIEIPFGDTYHQPAWYKYSPAPGQSGASVIIGHVDSMTDGASIFYNLSSLKPGDEIRVSRKDEKDAVFIATAIRRYSQKEFPTEKVYLSTTGAAELRLITCGGAFSETEGAYEDNIVVYAILKS